MIDDDVVVMDSQSRSLTPVEAYRKVAGLAEQVRDGGFVPSSRKSIPRSGAISAPRSTPSWIPAARIWPSWPRPSRRTAGPPWAGISSCTALPVEATEVARDPLCPVTESHIPTLLSGQTVSKGGARGNQKRRCRPRSRFGGDGTDVCRRQAGDRLRCLAGRPSAHGRSSGGTPRQIGPVGRLGRIGGISAVGAGIGHRSAGNKPEGAQSCGGQTRRRPGGQREQCHPRPGQDAQTESGHRLRRGRPLRTAADRRRRPGRSAAVWTVALNAVKAGKDVVITTGCERRRPWTKALSVNLSMQQTAEGIAAALGELCRRIATGADTERSRLDGRRHRAELLRATFPPPGSRSSRRSPRESPWASSRAVPVTACGSSRRRAPSAARTPCAGPWIFSNRGSGKERKREARSEVQARHRDHHGRRRRRRAGDHRQGPHG